ncbi:hypothetical protein AAFF_G00274970 [Aldrovandia affinis]|uniref:Uncharacterized protein n=1 Tax=Aldrovandia affinis TaxID=143900 RepID=A0AAD7WSR1_9TELE|nr:hypothetical protein AAFF_G00274970 [Aldrovandia affinis]
MALCGYSESMEEAWPGRNPRRVTTGQRLKSLAKPLSGRSSHGLATTGPSKSKQFSPPRKRRQQHHVRRTPIPHDAPRSVPLSRPIAAQKQAVKVGFFEQDVVRQTDYIINSKGQERFPGPRVTSIHTPANEDGEKMSDGPRRDS